MTRRLPAFTRALLLLCAAMLLGTAIAQEPLPLPPAPDEPTVTEEIPAPESTAEPEIPGEPTAEPTVEPVIPTEPTPVDPGVFVPPDSGPGRFDPDNLDAIPDILTESRGVVTRGNYDAAKLEGSLVDVMERFVHGDLEGADTAARGYWLPRDRRGRYLVVLWPAEGVNVSGVARRVKAAGGRIETVDSAAVYARLDKPQIALLSTDPKVGRIQPQSIGGAEPEATSALVGRSPTGEVVTEGFDIANAMTWHNAGLTGTSVNIAIIDFGFGASATAPNNELSCLGSYPAINLAFGGVPQAGDIRRGLDMAEVICDIAPNAKVRLYKVTTSNHLYDAINMAKNNNDIIVIGADFGVNFSPGDGSFGRESAKDVYQIIATAKASGVTIIAAAGNANQAYRTFTMLQGSTVTVSLNARPGDQINVSWNDWDTLPNNGGAREDINITLTGAGVNVGNSARPAGGNPARQIVVPSNCTLTGDFCVMTLNLSNITGNPVNNELIVQVNVSGGIGRSITNVAGATVNWFGGLNQAPTLSRPADSPHVIAVGAVCSNYEANFPLETYSGNGPKFNAGGSFNGLPAGDFYGPNEVKPEIVAPANVSVFNSELGVEEFSTCTAGFRGTQASAAHVAGMTALLLNNTLVSGFNGLNAPVNILHYWRTHSADMPLVAHPKGYDMQYGAGLAVLGMPTFDYDSSLSAPIFAEPNRLPPGVCTNVTYVGPRNAGNSDYDGTVNNPFQSIAHAANVQALAGGNRCVIVLPGEYVTPILFDNLSSAVGVFGYSGVTLNAGVERSTIVAHNKLWEPVATDFPRRAGVFADNSQNLVLGGLSFVNGDTYSPATFGYPSMVAVKNSPHFQLIRSRFNSIESNRPLVDIFGGTSDVIIAENRFINNNGLSGGSIIAVSDSGTPSERVSIRNNRFEGNVTIDGSWPMISSNHSISWVPMIRSLDSYTDVVNNIITRNSAEVLLQGATTLDDMPYEFRILGNAIVGNTIASAEFTTPGPLIHGFYQRYIMIVNNTIAENAFLNAGQPFDTLFGRGDEILSNAAAPMSGSMSEVLARWEIHGNLIANNGSSMLVREMDQAFAAGAGCVAFSGAAHQGASHNWLFNTYDGNPGDCATAIGNPSNNNIVNDNPVAEILAQGDPVNPEYWAPKGTATLEGPGHLKDGGPTAFLQANAGAILSVFVNNTLPVDVRGDARINNALVDIGAYEFTTFELLIDPISIVGIEDAGVIEFDINDPIYLTGGFPPYTATLVDAPDYYGTGCDSRFASPGTQGTAIEAIDAETLTIAYCPPHQFHTASSNPDLLANPPRMIINIFDAVGNSVEATINYTVNPVNDFPLNTSIETTAAVAISRNANHASGTNQVRLRPYVDFTGDSLLNGSKFYFSEWLNATGDVADESDYDYTYPGLPTLVAGDPINTLPANNAATIASNLVWIDQSRGIFGANLGAIGTPAKAKLQYTVVDANGNDVVNTMIVSAVPAPSPFVLLTPTDGFAVGNIDSFAGFTWEVSANAQKYDLVVARKIEPPYIEVIRLTGLTPEDDADRLECDAVNCVLELTNSQKLNLIDAEYRWAVYADNQGLKVRSDDQFDFVIQAGRELLLNGGFETQGTNTSLAASWTLNNGTKDKRVCGSGAASGACFFNFTANPTTTTTLVQKIGGIGRRGDVLTLTTSIKTTKLKAGTGRLMVIVKYTTGDKNKMTLSAASGTQNFALANAEPLTLRYPVASYVVKLQMRAGSGKMALDNVSLNLDEVADFDLLTPSDGTVSANAADITQLTWQVSASSPAYQVLLIESLSPGTPLVNGIFTAGADADALTCLLGQCIYNLPASLATGPGDLDGSDGSYVWTVTASNGSEADNSPFNFVIDSANLNELVINSGFEANNGKNIPTTWRVSKPGKSASVCESSTRHPEYQGACAFSFAGGSETTLSQILSSAGILTGHSLTLSAAAELQNAVPGAVVKLTVTYNNGSKEVAKLSFGSQTRLWQTYSDQPLVINGNIKKIALVASYKGKTGKLLLDNVSVIHSTQ